MDYPNVITIEGKEKEVVIWNLRGYFKFVVADGIVLADPKYLGELFSLHALGDALLCME